MGFQVDISTFGSVLSRFVWGAVTASMQAAMQGYRNRTSQLAAGSLILVDVGPSMSLCVSCRGNDLRGCAEAQNGDSQSSSPDM
jgi:hypothetical protein